MSSGLLIPLVTAILGGGGVTAVLAWLSARRKAQAEISSIVATGAEKAVLSLQAALNQSAAHAAMLVKERDRLIEEIERKDQRISNLEAQVDRLQSALDAIRTDIAALKRGD